jgi:hypothetical protein
MPSWYSVLNQAHVSDAPYVSRQAKCYNAWNRYDIRNEIDLESCLRAGAPLGRDGRYYWEDVPGIPSSHARQATCSHVCAGVGDVDRPGTGNDGDMRRFRCLMYCTHGHPV